MKKKDKGKEEKWDISLKASSYKGNKSKEESDNSNKEFSKKEEMGLFVRIDILRETSSSIPTKF